MQLKHENFHIYRGVSLAKIPGLGQFLPSKIAKIQIFWFHSNELCIKMKFKHENFRIYRGVSLEKIPGLGQFLQSKMAKIQIFWFLINDL